MQGINEPDRDLVENSDVKKLSEIKQLPKEESSFIRWLDKWVEKLFGNKGLEGTAAFKGDLSVKVIRRNATFLQKIKDFLRGHL